MFFDLKSLNVDVSLLRKHTFIFLKGLANKIGKWKISWRQLGVLLLWVLVLFFVGFFSYAFEKKLSDFQSAFHAKKRWLLTNFVFLTDWIYSFFSEFEVTPFLLLFIRHQFIFSARKCSLFQRLACTDRRSHKQKRSFLWDSKLLNKDRDACLSFCFSNPQ